MPLSEPAKAVRFAKSYVALVNALIKQGVPEGIARAEARSAALIEEAALAERKDCPVCGTKV